ncbi:biotin--[acetyl-CoA-carboxylase] ligase [Tabrizicola sp. J26]|uniref:biotin--[acetyl-CoA-carboxylase] ligase n=1 Tax=Alitabrizicola rongguiensis TaxID=2909234 RepID=UPI001F19C980|nr:biotin--[acetyl-CoA-carboxylase] ligase [Tabrizicola rongguiensis]MCF1709576.1 biotin--[acetyl-CoA-carboxylase] ligase [Tabrizicola rongguiensis]
MARRVLPSVDSTNAEAARLAAEMAGPCWVLGLEQTGGRGRRGRPWVSPKGNFYATLLMHPTEAPDVVALRSFAAALALRDALVGITGLPDAFQLKWPNDVLLNGGKLAGILLESAGQGGRVGHLAIGIGVNLISAPDPATVEPGAVAPVSLLSEIGLRVTPEAFLDRLAPAYARREAVFVRDGFAPLREAWLAHAARLGEPIRARTGTRTDEGVFETIDASGALVLRQPDGRLAIPAAEVFF